MVKKKSSNKKQKDADFKCPHCNQYFFNQAQLDKHLKEDCPYVTRGDKEIEKDVKLSEIPKIEKKGTKWNIIKNDYVCSYCGADVDISFPSGVTTCPSCNKKINFDGKWICGYCDKVFKSEAELNEHMKSCGNSDSSTDIRCSKCGTTFHNMYEYNQHLAYCVDDSNKKKKDSNTKKKKK